MVFFYGMLTIVFAAFCNKFPGILIAAYSLLGAISGPVLGVFTLGLLFPFANSRVCLLIFFYCLCTFSNSFCFFMRFSTYLQFSKKINDFKLFCFFTCDSRLNGLDFDGQVQLWTANTFAKCTTFIFITLDLCFNLSKFTVLYTTRQYKDLKTNPVDSNQTLSSKVMVFLVIANYKLKL